MNVCLQVNAIEMFQLMLILNNYFSFGNDTMYYEKKEQLRTLRVLRIKRFEEKYFFRTRNARKWENNSSDRVLYSFNLKVQKEVSWKQYTHLSSTSFCSKASSRFFLTLLKAFPRPFPALIPDVLKNIKESLNN